MKRVYGTIFVHEKSKGEVLEKGSKTEKHGYQTTEQKVLAMLKAGVQLENIRHNYDFETQAMIDEAFMDQTREPNFDMADASRLLRQTTARIEVERKRRAEERKKNDEEKNLQDGKKNDERSDSGEAKEESMSDDEKKTTKSEKNV